MTVYLQGIYINVLKRADNTDCQLESQTMPVLSPAHTSIRENPILIAAKMVSVSPKMLCCAKGLRPARKVQVLKKILAVTRCLGRSHYA